MAEKKWKWPKLKWWHWALITGSIGTLGFFFFRPSRADAASGPLGLPSPSGTSPSGTTPSGQESDALFEAFWQTAGREESRNNLTSWLPNDVGSGPSIGWMHFNQRFSIHLLLREAHAIDPSAYADLMGGYANDLLNERFVKSQNLNASPYKGLLLQFLASPLGINAQRAVARKYYFNPAMEMLGRVRPNADNVYRVVAASTRILTRMSNVEEAARQSPTAEDFTEYFKNKYQGQEIWHRFDRQLKNARSTVATGQLAIR